MGGGWDWWQDGNEAAPRSVDPLGGTPEML